MCTFFVCESRMSSLCRRTAFGSSTCLLELHDKENMCRVLYSARCAIVLVHAAGIRSVSSSLGKPIAATANAKYNPTAL